MASIANRMEARRATRRRTDAPSTLRAGSEGPVDTFVHDVSQTGARIETATPLEIGDFVSIGLGGVGAVRAIVVWAREQQFGLDFVIPLTDEDAERAFGVGTVVSLTPPQRAERPAMLPESEGEDEDGIGVYAEATGWLSVLMFTLIAGTVLAVALIRGWIF
jgi:hypothetical protein